MHIFTKVIGNEVIDSRAFTEFTAAKIHFRNEFKKLRNQCDSDGVFLKMDKNDDNDFSFEVDECEVRIAISL